MDFEAVAIGERKDLDQPDGVGLEKIIRRQRESSAVIKTEAIKHGMRTLRDDGWSKVLNGVTTIEGNDAETALTEALAG